VNVDVYADTLSNATGTYTNATAITGYSGTGAVSYTSVNFSGSAIEGQEVSFSGQPALVIAQDSSNPATGQIVQNSQGNALAAFRFSETSNVESVKVTQLNVIDEVASSAVKAAFSNVALYQGTTLLGTSQSPILDAAGTAYIYVFNSFTNPLIVPQGSSVSLTLKGTAGSVVNGSMTDDSTSTFAIATTTDNGVLTNSLSVVTPANNTMTAVVVARGATSNKTAGATLSSATGNAQTTLRTTLAVSATPVTGAPPASLQPIGSITFTANSAGDAIPNNLILTFSTSSTAFLNTVLLKDQSGNDIVATDAWAATTTTSNAAQIEWNFATSTKPLVVTAGQSYTLTLWGDLSKIPAVSSQGLSLTAQIAATTDFGYLDADNGSNPTSSLVYLTQNQVPITVTSLTSGAGLPL